MEATEPSAKPARHRNKVMDTVSIVAMAIIIIVLGVTLMKQLSLKHEVSSAKVTTNRIITDLQKQNASDLHSLGDKAFQSSHSVSQLQSLTKNAVVYVKPNPSVRRQIVTNDKLGQKVAVIYKFNNKKPFYVGVTVNKLKGVSSWHLIGLSGSTNEADLAK